MFITTKNDEHEKAILGEQIINNPKEAVAHIPCEHLGDPAYVVRQPMPT